MNIAITVAYWLIGKQIVEFEQRFKCINNKMLGFKNMPISGIAK